LYVLILVLELTSHLYGGRYSSYKDLYFMCKLPELKKGIRIRIRISEKIYKSSFMQISKIKYAFRETN